MELMNTTDLTKNAALIFNPKYAIEALRIKNKELNVDISILKRLVYMLNVELESRDTNKKIKNKFFSNQETYDKYLKSEEIRMIEPLLEAFQQTLAEKEHLIANYKQSFDEFSHYCKEIMHENDILRQQLQELKQKSESACVEWKKLHDEFLLIQEHNQLLMRQIKLFQNKIHCIESAYQSSVKQIESEKYKLSEKLETKKTELLTLKGKFCVLSEVYDTNIKSNPNNPWESSLYESVIKEIKNLSVELKLHHKSEIETLRKKIATLESQNCETEIHLATATSERDHLQGYVSALESEIRRVNSNYEELELELQNAKKDQCDAKKQVFKCISFIRELVSVHNSLLNQI